MSDASIDHRVKALESRVSGLESSDRETDRLTRANGAAISALRQQLKGTRESLSRAFVRIESVETEDRATGRELVQLQGTLAAVDQSLQGVQKALETVNQMSVQLAAVATTVSHHNRALWLIAGFALSVAGSIIVYVATR